MMKAAEAVIPREERMQAMRFRRLQAVFLCLAALCLAARAGAESWLFPPGLLEIEAEAFSGCAEITEAVLPEGLVSIGDGAFQNCSGLRRAVLPASVETVGDQAFDGCAEAFYILCQPETPAAAWAAASGFDWSAGTVCRALVIGQSYTGTGYALQGPVYDMHAVAGLLRHFQTRTYTVTEKTNLTAEGILSAIGSAFSGATADDISLLYYSGHGLEGGYLVGQDIENVSPDALRAALDRISGRKVILVDACYSGALLEDGQKGVTRKGGSPLGSFAQDFAAAFYSNTRSLKGTSYYVMTACQAAEECGEGYIRSGSSGRSMGFFTYSLCQGCGWDGVKNQAISPLADSSGDGVVTFAEAYSYAASKAYEMNPVQSAVVYPAQCTWFSPFRP